MNTIGAASEPDRENFAPTYVPGLTMTVSPGDTTFAAFCIVANGWPDVPGFESEPVGDGAT